MIVTAVIPVMAENNIKVRLGDELIKFDVQPQLINNRTMVPLRAIFEALGATVDWNGDTQTIISTKEDTTISLTINDPTMYVDGKPVKLDSPACLVNGRTLVPVRAISEAFNLKVDWDNSTKTVLIKKTVSVVSEEFMMLTDLIGVTWKYTYDKNGVLIAKSHDGGLTVEREFDENGYLIKEISTTTFSDGEADVSVTTYTNDSNGNVLLETDEYGWKKYVYENNLLKSWTNSNNASCFYTYDSNNRLIMEKYSATDGWTKYEYRDDGQISCKYTNYKDKDVYEYDKSNKLKAIVSYDSDGKIFNTETFEYDINGNLIFSSTTYGSWAKYIQIER